MLDIGVYNALLVRAISGPFDAEGMAMTCGGTMTNPCVTYVNSSPYPIFALNHYGCSELPVLTQEGKVVMPEGMAVAFFGSFHYTEVLQQSVEAITLGVVHHRVHEGVYEPWVRFLLQDGRQGEFSINVYMRTMLEICELGKPVFGVLSLDKPDSYGIL